MNVLGDTPWCIAFQSPHFVEHCAVAWSLVTYQDNEFDKFDQEETNDDIGCNMNGSYLENEDVSDVDEETNVYLKRHNKELFHQEVFSDYKDIDEKTCNMNSSSEKVKLRRP